jgi:hypothetical protein
MAKGMFARAVTILLKSAPSLAAATFIWGQSVAHAGAAGDPSIAGSPEDKAVGVNPFIRLEKNQYVMGETIRFWIGVKSKNAALIPANLRKDGSLLITKPDGSTEVQTEGWPIDGMAGGEWSGGAGLGKVKVEPGRYVLVFECDGVKTPPTELVVVKNDLMSEIKAEFRFERQGVVNMDTPVWMVLTVQNGTATTIRFPQIGVMEGVGLDIERKEPAFGDQTFYPWEKLAKSKNSWDTYNWNDASEVPAVVLGPGEHFEQRFLLKDAYSPDREGDYEVTIETVLPILAGTKEGEFASMCPFRLPVTASAKLVFKSK